MAATFAEVLVFAALSLASVNSIVSHVQSTPAVCPDKTGKLVTVPVGAPGATVQLQCQSSNVLTPTIEHNTMTDVFTNQECTSEKALSELCPGATGKLSGETLTLTIPQLPPTATTLYVKCAAAVGALVKEEQNSCVFAVAIQEAPLQGLQVCAVPDTTIKLALHGENGAVTFACGTTLETLSLKPTDKKRVYKDDCTKEEDLKDMELSLSGSTYTLKATKKPHDKTLCYLCQSGEKISKKECKVLIAVSSATRFAVLSSVGFALPCILTSLYLI